MIALLASALEVKPRQLRLVAGVASRDKIVELEGLDAGEAESRLLRAGGSR